MISIKKYIMNISLILIISVLFTQNLDLFTQKITLENSLRDKIYSELERVLNKNKNRFVVVVNLELGKYGDLISKNQTIIKDGAFIGSNTSLIAPVIINKNVKIGAGSVIDKDIPTGNLALERSKLKIIKKK